MELVPEGVDGTALNYTFVNCSTCTLMVAGKKECLYVSDLAYGIKNLLLWPPTVVPVGVR